MRKIANQPRNREPGNRFGIRFPTPVVTFRANHEQTLGLVRSLGRLGVRVICVDDDATVLAAKSRYCGGRVPWNFKSSPPEASACFLVDLARKLGTKPILIPNGDHFSLFADQYADLLATAYLFPRPRPGAVARLYSKRDLYELCRETGVPTATIFFPASLEEALGAVAHMIFPVVLKAIDPDRLARHARVRMRVIHVPSDLSGAYRALDEPGPPNLALQEFIPTDAEGSGVISAYFDGHGACRFAITARKLRQLPIDGGVTSLAVCAPCDAMVESLSRIVKAAGYRGIVDADFCRDTRDGQWKLLDVNPRMGANFRALVDRNGLDVARALYLDLTGQDIPPVEPEWGRRWLNEKKDWGALRSHVRAGSLTYRDWFRSVRSVSEFAYWSWSDPGPSVRFAARVAGRRLRGLVEKLREYPSR